MNQLMRIISLSTILALALALPASAEPGKHDPALLGVIMYADWCNSCKVLEPNIDKVKRDFQDKGVLFLRFDMTDEFTTAQSAQHASLLGLSELFDANKGKTGYMVLIDRRDGNQQVGRLTRNDKPQAIRTALNGALR